MYKMIIIIIGTNAKDILMFEMNKWTQFVMFLIYIVLSYFSFFNPSTKLFLISYETPDIILDPKL